MPETLPANGPEHLKLVIIDDHPLFLEGLSLTLRNLSPTVEIHCFGSLAEARAAFAQKDDVDLVLLDLMLPDGRGLSFLRDLQSQALFIPTIVISASTDSRDVKAALMAGANGFISKSAGGKNIIKHIKAALNGDVVLPDFYLGDQACHPLQPVEILTPRQQEVLLLIAEGMSNKAICQRLNLTEHTVKTHIKALFQNLDVHSRTECVHVATVMGLLEST